MWSLGEREREEELSERGRWQEKAGMPEEERETMEEMEWKLNKPQIRGEIVPTTEHVLSGRITTTFHAY